MAPSAPIPNPEPLSEAGGPAGFAGLVETAFQSRASYVADPSWVLQSGELEVETLCRYAVGKVTTSERRNLEAYLNRTPWAVTRVTALIKGARAGGSLLAAQVATAAKAGAVDPYRVASLALLESLGRADAASIIAQQASGDLTSFESEPLIHAACLLGMRKLEPARDRFAEVDSLPPLAETAQRLSSLPDEDEALLELLNAI